MTTHLTLRTSPPHQGGTPAVDLPAAGPQGQRTLLDRHGRVARDLRVSLTDRCNLRCTYCMPAEGLEWLPTEQSLSYTEVTRLIRIAVELLGIRQIRFTGGEPLLRRELAEIIAFTSALRTDEDKPVQTALTTNGLGLDKKAGKLHAAGLNRINISLDTIDAERYKTLTRRDRLKDVLAGIEAAIDAGLEPVKINAVVMPGVNEEDIVPLARYCLEQGAQLRFIEQMPLGPRDQWKRSEMVTAADILAHLQQEFSLTPAVEPRGSAPAALWEVAEYPGEHIGVIASVTHSFCGDCDRSRLTADGAIRNCLFANTETPLRELLRSGATDTELATAWAQAMWGKLPGHGIDDPGFLQPRRTMSAIGG
ncbi:Cyclic pyranopterin monophosphate synthase [Corynebacterium occultum]|uniref:GTP 3',8-cyclase n=1 Tax=Corynebacterium occultum TaxID=2675219 RepID=A0A6B8VNH6_9CORY|nr:GTP 3',8-cyclase MoaA [Corynebacterium occultum]QGU07082.1 Cyclic pyranopterin monophosphate synthase [Corynebacterium occultum]